MKKLISVLLAVLVAFSVVTVAFAAEDETPQENQTQLSINDLIEAAAHLLIGDGTVEDIPLVTAKAGFKVAKIFLKLAKAFIKVGDALGFLNAEDIIFDIAKSLAGMIVGNDVPEPTPESTTTPAEPAAP